MNDYVLDHHLEGEGARLALMSRLLDPMHRRHIRELGIEAGDRALEVGCGNGSISAWMAEEVAPDGSVVGLDLDLSLIAWSREQGIDYGVGRKLAPQLAALGLDQIEGTAETAVYNGGSPWAEYWTDTITELRGPLVGSGHLDDGLIDTFLAHCADSTWWTETISFTAVRARKT
jgi:SAM-dependent methyltransferase